MSTAIQLLSPRRRPRVYAARRVLVSHLLRAFWLALATVALLQVASELDGLRKVGILAFGMALGAVGMLILSLRLQARREYEAS